MGSEKDFPKFLKRDFLFDNAEHLAFAKDTANVAFAPKFVLFSVPSSSNNILSIFDWSFEFIFFNLGEILLLIFFIAILTLFPRNKFLS